MAFSFYVFVVASAGEPSSTRPHVFSKKILSTALFCPSDTQSAAGEQMFLSLFCTCRCNNDVKIKHENTDLWNWWATFEAPYASNVCIGNHMISSAIGNIYARVISFAAEQNCTSLYVGWVQILVFEKNYKCFFNPNCTRKIMCLLIKEARMGFLQLMYMSRQLNWKFSCF